MTHKANFDRTVTLGVLITLAIQTSSALLWAGGMQSRMQALESKAAQTLDINLRLTRLEVNVSAVRRTLEDMHDDISDIEEATDE